MQQELQQMLFDINSELEHLLSPTLPDQEWRSSEDASLKQTNVLAAAERAYAVASGAEWKGDVFEESWLADLDRFYHLYQCDGVGWGTHGTGRKIERLINAVMVMNDLELGADIEIGRTAEFFGIAEKTLRNALSAGQLAYGESTGKKTTITAASLKDWLRNKPRYRLPSEQGSLPAGVDPALAGARPTRENLEALFQAVGIQRHSKDRAPNRYMHAYQTPGVTFAHEHQRQTQHLWFPIEAISDVNALAERFVTKTYPATSLKAARYGRHSGLKKYPELAEGRLLRVSPRTTEEAWAVLTALDLALATETRE